MALSALLVGGGYLIGEQQAEQSPVIQEQAVTPASNASAGANTVPATTALPIVDLEQAAIEPATAVARAVTPSVVQIITGSSQGSGIIWDAANGYIVTNDHVTDTADTVSVLLHNGVEVSGVVIGGDSARDISVVQIDPGDLDLVEATFAPSETVEFGQWADAIGSPFGLDQSVTAGIVSAATASIPSVAPTRRIRAGRDDPDRRPDQPGNSGVRSNRDGHVIGMNTSIRTDGSSDNAGWALRCRATRSFDRRADHQRRVARARFPRGQRRHADRRNARCTRYVGSPWCPRRRRRSRGWRSDHLCRRGGGGDHGGAGGGLQVLPPGELVKIEVLRDGERLVFDVTSDPTDTPSTRRAGGVHR